MNLQWNVYEYSTSNKKIESTDIFRLSRFREDVKMSLKTCDDKAVFEDELRRHLAYHYWAKCEHEIVLTSWTPRITMTELDRLNIERKRFNDEYNKDPCSFSIRPNVAEKVDVYDQVRLNWDAFVDYVWSHKQ